MSQPEEDFTDLTPEDRGLETPAEDSVEQATPADPAEGGSTEVHRGMEVGEYDAVEQARVVQMDDEYR